MAHHRLFVAIRPPAAIRAALRGLCDGVPGARWQDDEQFHLTLRFIGAVDHHRAEDIAAALGRVRHAPFEVRLDQWGTFDREGRVDTLWIGIAPKEAARALHRKIDRAIGAVGIPPDDRAYLPHVTVARIPRGAGVSSDIVRDRPGPPALAFRVGDFRLYESHLGTAGASYEAIARYALG